MTAQEVLDPANAAEAEMAAVAHQCLVTALDHSNADHISLILDVGTDGNEKYELTTQEAANFLNVSRPFVIKEIEANRLKCRKVNRHRRIEFEELRRYQAAQQQQSEQALQDLTQLSEDLGLEF